jgi:hypothetical protein
MDKFNYAKPPFESVNPRDDSAMQSNLAHQQERFQRQLHAQHPQHAAHDLAAFEHPQPLNAQHPDAFNPEETLHNLVQTSVNSE